MTTIRLPAISGRAASSSAAWKAAPAEMPTSRPSRSAARAPPRSAVSSSTAITSSITVAVEDLGHEAGADPLDLVRARRPAGEHRRGRRLDRDDVDARAALLEHLADAGDRAAGADAADERVDLAVEVAPRSPRPSSADGSRGWRGWRTAAA